MKRLSGAIVMMLLAAGGATDPASAQNMPAQGFNLYGAWSGQMQTQNGPITVTVSYNPDGTYVSVGRAPNGAIQRIFGVYQARMVGEDQLIVQTQPRGRQPSAMCSRILSRGITNCVPVPLPAPETEQISIISQTVMQVQASAPGQPTISLTSYRDPNPVLLSANIPDQQMTDLSAPPMPQAPTITPYDQSPVHKGMNDFIYGRLRGCQYKDVRANGTYYSECDR